jgi:predicted naringenin-chalcone synthase
MKPKPIIALTDFQVQMPALWMDQLSSLEYIGQVHAKTQTITSEELLPRLKRFGVKPTQISKRYFENTALAANGDDILTRTRVFAERGREIVEAFYPARVDGAPLLPPPDHLIHVTCTGYVSPSPVQQVVTKRGWAGETAVTHAYHMGCYASLPAVRIAEGLVAARNKHVDIIHTEMCALHMDRTDHSAEQLVVQSLFADGHIKYSAKSLDAVTSGYQVLAIKELIIPDSQQDMSWITASWGMKMTLSREVPAKIAVSLRKFVLDLCHEAEVDFVEILKSGVFAIHPGGPKIIDLVQENLELSDEQVRASREVLFERGNMSSATLPHVWYKLQEQKTSSRKKVLSLAFGPGLTIFGALFEVI